MYSYDRTASGPSTLLRVLKDHAASIEEDLKEKALTYCGRRSDSKAKVEVTERYMKFSVWLDMGPDSTPDEARELSQILLGNNAAVASHRLVPNMWVATIYVDVNGP